MLGSWRVPTLLLSLASVGGLCCCGGAEVVAIAVVPKGTQHEFWKAVHAGARAAGQAASVEVRWKGPDPEGDRQAQIHLLQNFVISGVRGIVLAPIDEQALVRPVAEAVAHGVPVVVIDSGLQGTAHAAFVATDNHAGGTLAGQHLGRLLEGRGKVVVLRFQQGSASTTAREAGCLEALATLPGIEVVDSGQYAGDTEKAQKTAASLLLAHPDVAGVFCPNESATHGFLLALQQSGRAGQVKFVGFDGSAPLQQGLAQGHLHGLVLQDPVAMGRRGMELLLAHLRGEAIERTVCTDLQLATPENRNEPRIRALLQPDLSILDR